ncbi:MAG: transcriptional regulator, HxlR family [Sphingobacteriales bacterium]|nr:transcriptional regulator, HxlR family [Sphingobacteriales bacterium]
MEETEEVIDHSTQTCTRMLLHVQDALEVLNGKWKLPILLCLTFGERRFRQIAKDIGGITDKMLSKELKDMEVNKLIKRTVLDSFPPTVIYSVTDHGKSLKPVIDELAIWGNKHREEIIGIRQKEKS